MTYTPPPDFNAGDPLTEADLDTLSQDITDLDQRVQGTVASACVVSRNTNQSISNNTDTYVNFTIENLDIGGWFPGSGTTITVPASAIPDGATTILLGCAGDVTFATNSTGARIVELHVNGSLVSGAGNTNYGLASDPTVVILNFKIIEVAAGDTIKLNVKQTSGGSLNLTVARFDLHRIGQAS